ncbi:MAG: triose-phosphate isomerase [Holosporales bacterium]|jgi:triosephosphate isomerase|nr:triose-phosphate isomerase [Holosporales bacterium]
MSKLIVGNWKMNGDLSLVDVFLDGFRDIDVVIAFPSIFTAYACQRATGALKIAAQDCSIYDDFGAHTGEISAKMLRAAGVQHVIVGHSERRASCSASDTIQHVFKKLQNVIANDMTAILCVDENFHQLLNEETLRLLNHAAERIIVAYEPISAIGTGHIPALAEIAAVIAKIKLLTPSSKILYGGSVSASSAGSLFSSPSIDGCLIGGASLSPAELLRIYKASHVLC